MKQSINFIFDCEFDGDFEKLIKLVKSGEAIQYNSRPFPVLGSHMQGKQLVLPLYHKTIFVDLSDAVETLKRSPKTRISMNIGK